MGKPKKQSPEKWESDGGNYIPVHYDVVDSKAFVTLSGNAVKVYIYMRRKNVRKRIDGVYYDSNCSDISMPELGSDKKDKFGGRPGAGYTKIGLGQRAFHAAIDQLIDHGFVRLVKSGYETKTCNIYGFVDTWKKYGKSDFLVKPEHRRTKSQQEYFIEKLNHTIDDYDEHVRRKKDWVNKKKCKNPPQNAAINTAQSSKISEK